MKIKKIKKIFVDTDYSEKFKLNQFYGVNMFSNIKLECLVNRLYLPANKNTGPLFFSIKVEPDEETQIRNIQLPLDVCILIDTSVSMRGNNLEYAKTGAQELINRLGPSDYVTVIDFSDSPIIVVPNTKIDDKEEIIKKLANIQVRGSTGLYAGLKSAYAESQKSTDVDSVKRIILLTDGHPTDVNDNSPLYLQTAKEMRESGISIISLGIGEGYNEHLLMLLSQNSNGSWYHITTPDTIPGIFSSEIVNMSTVLLTKPEIFINTIDGVELFDLMKAEPNIHEIQIQHLNGGCKINLNDVASGIPQTIVGKIKAPIKPAGQYRLLKIDLLNSETPVSKNIIVNYTDDENLYIKENNVFPRDFLKLTQNTIFLQNAVSAEDTQLIEKGKTQLKSLIEETIIQDIKDKGTLIHETVLKQNTVKEKLEGLTQIRK